GRSEARLDITGLQVSRLPGLERFTIALVRRIERGGSISDCELAAHIPAQIPVGGFPESALRVAVNQVSEFFPELAGAAPRHLLHARPIKLSGLIQRDG